MSHTTRRGLSREFMKDLKEGLLQPILKQVRSDGTLLLQIRNEYISIYYRGGTLSEIHRQPEGSYKETFDAGYYDTQSPNRASGKETSFLKGEDDVGTLLKQLRDRKHAMDCFFGGHSAGEREVQQAIVRANNCFPIGRATDYYFCDIEYKTTLGEFDMIGVCWPSTSGDRKKCEGHRLVLAELKHGDSAIERTADLCKHVRDINSHLEDSEDLKKLKNEMVGVFNQQRELGLIDCGKDLVSFGDETPLLLILISDHDPAQPQLRKQLDSLPESPHVEISFATGSFMGYGIFNEGIRTKDELYQRCGWRP